MTTTTRTLSRVVAPTAGSRWRERGSVSVETAILLPALAALIVLAVVVGQSSIAYNHVAAAAHDAARAASLSRTEQAATAQATAVAQAVLDELDCEQTDIMVNAEQVNLPVGEPAMVDVTVVCTLDFADVGLPLSRTLEATFASPVDVWRGRGGPQ